MVGMQVGCDLSLHPVTVRCDPSYVSQYTERRKGEGRTEKLLLVVEELFAGLGSVFDVLS